VSRWPLALVLASSPAAAYCPSYTASSPSNTHACAIEAAPGENPSIAEWNEIFAVVSQGPAVWGSAGPTVPDLRKGCDPATMVPARFPCELLKAIAMTESGWKQFCEPDRPPDQVGKSSRTIISFDCGYGVGQVTSGMHVGESPSFDRERVAGDPTYNLATGTRILADKWRAVKCVGDRDPTVIEHWYSATWAYNGLAYSNNPTNPNYDANRGVWNPAVGGAAPYQEKVWGYMEHTSRWDKTPLAYPALADIGGEGSPGDLPEPRCASPTDCSATRPVHVTSCQGGVAPVADAGVSLPDATVAGVADAAPPTKPSVATDVTGGCSLAGTQRRKGHEGPDPDLCVLCVFVFLIWRASGARSTTC
jgi:hypothetical protein